MARLKSHGFELIRLRKDSQLGAAHDDTDGTTVERYLAFMSDGTVLKRSVFIHVSEFGTGRTERVDDGWKMSGKTFHNAIAKHGLDHVAVHIRADFSDWQVSQ